ncbi:MAG: enoyl-CoA hydratase/isomerase family protein, partial [Alphaproteobacteria bacterium]|nr:enoyl-CoA hydratase/isomerase family protein [Alphaproteobacteria bacterium]
MDAVLVSRDARGVATVTLNRPERRNAFDDALIRALDRLFADLARDPAVRVVVLTGAGSAFSAGADINWMRRMAGYSKRENRADAMGLARMLRRLDTLPKPTVARVNGAAYAGAIGLVCACDVAIAAAEATFAISEVRLGLLPATIAPYVTATIGARQARRFNLTGEAFGADEALRIGLVHKIAPLAELDAAVGAIVDALLQGAPSAQAKAKRMIAAVAGKPITPTVMARTAGAIAEARAAPEGREGLAAFLEKRKPRFRT